MPKCINIREAHVVKEETSCVQNCVKALHKTHIRVFDHLSDFENRQSNEE